MTDESDESDATHEPRRAVVGAVGGGVLASIGAWWLSRDGGESTEPQSAATTATTTATATPRKKRSDTATGTRSATDTDTATQTPRDTPTPTDRPTPTKTATQTPTETGTETAVSTAASVDAISRTVWMSDTVGRVDFVLKDNFSDAEWVGWGRTTQTDDGTVYPTLRARVAQDTPKLAARAELQGDFSRVDRYTATLSGLHTAHRLNAGETVNLRPAFEPVDGLRRVVFALDDSKRIQSPTPTPTPTDNGFL